MNRDILFRQDGWIFSYRVAGILMHEGKILLQKPVNDDFAIPGGHVMSFETSKETLVREFREEICADVEVGDLIAVGDFGIPAFAGDLGSLYHEVHGPIVAQSHGHAGNGRNLHSRQAGRLCSDEVGDQAGQTGLSTAGAVTEVDVADAAVGGFQIHRRIAQQLTVAVHLRRTRCQRCQIAPAVHLNHIRVTAGSGSWESRTKGETLCLES